MSAQTKSPNKWVLLLLGAVLVTAAFVIRFTARQAPPQVPKLSTATVTNEIVWLAPATVRRIFPPPASRSAMEEIERAERHNLYEMQRYQRRVLRDLQSRPSTLPVT